MVVKILINTSVKNLNKVYDYKVPYVLEHKVAIGKRVEVNFGASRKSNEEGIIVKIIEESPEEEAKRQYKLKEIIAILDEVSYISEERLRLAKYMAHIYFCNVYDVLKLMLPPGTTSKNSSKSLHTKQESKLVLLKSEAEIMQDIESELITSGKHVLLLKFLLDNEMVFVNDVVEGLGISRAIITTVQKKGYLKIEKVDPPRDLMEDLQVSKTEPQLPTPEQKHAIDTIGMYIYEEEFKECLLFGVTGSGKTEVYLQLLEKVLMQGKKAIILVPEISLTYQTLTRFVSRFGNNIAILHSRMTVSKRKEEYKRICKGEVDIVIGARSAIFAPLENIGMVIIDEEHDSSYYSGTTPKYSTKEVARYLCKENNAVLLLGSATPEIISYYRAISNKIELVQMKERPGNAILPKVELVDMKEERILGNTSLLSSNLREEIKKNIQNKEQTMLFLNRRGYTSYFTCKDCGFIYKCPNCDVAMTYHKKNNLLLCHYCSHVEKNVNQCPRCNSDRLTSGSIGTQKLEEELKEIYPEISLLRMDADTTVTRDSHQKILDQFKNENINVLIGTQMISKGHDIANVTLVGILGVDSLLAMQDYTASEKAFSNISQVSGRAGRGEIQGRVIIQTNDPENYILHAVEKHSYKTFFEQEIEFRKNFHYPPFDDIILFELVGASLGAVKAEAEKLYEILNQKTQSMYQVYSPKSPYIQKLNNKYRVNVIMKTKLSTPFYQEVYGKIKQFRHIQKKDIRMTVTVNPNFLG